MEVVTDAQSCRELEQRLQALQTSLNAVERSITKFEDLIEDCRLVEEELYQVEEDKAHQEELHQMEEEEACQEKEETTNIEMDDEEECSNPESSGPCMEADTEIPLPLVSTGDAVSTEEDALLMQQAHQPDNPAAGSHSPRSETSMVSGGMAELCLTSLSHPGPGEDETPPWVSILPCCSLRYSI